MIYTGIGVAVSDMMGVVGGDGVSEGFCSELTRREEALDDTRRSFTLDLEIIISRLQSFGTELTREKSFSTNCSK